MFILNHRFLVWSLFLSLNDLFPLHIDLALVLHVYTAKLLFLIVYFFLFILFLLFLIFSLCREGRK